MKTIKYIYILIILLTIYSCSWKVGIITDDGDSKYYASNKAKKSMYRSIFFSLKKITVIKEAAKVRNK